MLRLASLEEYRSYKMADVIDQREARRLKIIQNAQARMNRLLGLTENQEPNNEPKAQNSASDTSHSQPSQQPYNLRLRSHAPAASSGPSPDQKPGACLPNVTVNRTTNRHFDDHVSNRHTPSTTETVTGDSRGLPNLPSKSETTSKKTDVSSVSHLAKGLTTRKIEISKIIILVVTSFLARVVLTFGIGICLVQSIVVPFVVLELAFEYMSLYHLQHIPLYTSKGSMMSAALMLCGMKQELMDTYNTIMAHVTSWFSDFSLFMFSFFVWNIFVA